MYKKVILSIFYFVFCSIIAFSQKKVEVGKGIVSDPLVQAQVRYIKLAEERVRKILMSQYNNNVKVSNAVTSSPQNKEITSTVTNLGTLITTVKKQINQNDAYLLPTEAKNYTTQLTIIQKEAQTLSSYVTNSVLKAGTQIGEPSWTADGGGGSGGGSSGGGNLLDKAGEIVKNALTEAVSKGLSSITFGLFGGGDEEETQEATDGTDSDSFTVPTNDIQMNTAERLNLLNDVDGKLKNLYSETVEIQQHVQMNIRHNLNRAVVSQTLVDIFDRRTAKVNFKYVVPTK